MQNKTIYINKYSRPQGVDIIAESDLFFVCRMRIGCDEYEPIFIQKQSDKYYNTFEEAYKECFEYKQTQKSEELKKEIEELEERIKELKIQESRSLENQKHYIERLAQIGQLKNLSKEEIKEKLLKTIEEILN
jgi:predicted enzyme involved in methoxymalonyl-ACP biosynthesis